VIHELSRNVTADDIPMLLAAFLAAVAWQVFRPRRSE
jgi:hypothetical protein